MEGEEKENVFSAKERIKIFRLQLKILKVSSQQALINERHISSSVLCTHLSQSHHFNPRNSFQHVRESQLRFVAGEDSDNRNKQSNDRLSFTYSRRAKCQLTQHMLITKKDRKEKAKMNSPPAIEAIPTLVSAASLKPF